MSRGLPYGWWKRPELWALVVLYAVMGVVMAAWWLDLKAWW